MDNSLISKIDALKELFDETIEDIKRDILNSAITNAEPSVDFWAGFYGTESHTPNEESGTVHSLKKSNKRNSPYKIRPSHVARDEVRQMWTGDNLGQWLSPSIKASETFTDLEEARYYGSAWGHACRELVKAGVMEFKPSKNPNGGRGTVSFYKWKVED